jgi:hypothetical protein
MSAGCFRFIIAAAVLAAATALPIGAAAQTPRDETAAPPSVEPAYRPPLRGAPGGLVGGASRGLGGGASRDLGDGASRDLAGGASRSLFRAPSRPPTIKLLAPSDHAGLSANPTPSLFFFVSGPVGLPLRFTISADGRPAPVLEARIRGPAAAGIYRLDVADYGVRLEPGTVYTWSVSAIRDPRIRARDIIASASLMLSAPDPAGAVASPTRRAALYAGAGLWYDAVAAAVAAAPVDRHAALDALLGQVGLAGLAAYVR